MQNFKFKILLGLLSVVVFQSCIGSKDFLYLRDFQKIDGQFFDDRPTILKEGDKLSISVSSKDPLAAEKFNLGAQRVTTDETETTTASYYLVREDGYITFPELDSVELGGKSLREAESYMSERLSQYFKGYKPPVKINIQNFRFTIIGEIGAPGNYEVAENKISVVEAIAEAGDIPLEADKTKVKVIRTENGVKSTGELDFTSIDVINSPFYWLVQGDVIIVAPSKYTLQQAVIGPYAQILLSLGISIVTSIILLSIRNN